MSPLTPRTHGIGAVLYQIIKGETRHIAFMARALSKSERNYSTTKRELLAIVFAFTKFHKYLWGNKFTLFTDHKALTYIHTQTKANAMMINWMDTLFEYDFDIVHLPRVSVTSYLTNCHAFSLRQKSWKEGLMHMQTPTRHASL